MKTCVVDNWVFSQLGPFVDSEHPDLKKGTVDRTFDEIFHFEILRKVFKGKDSFWKFYFFFHISYSHGVICHFQLEDYVEHVGSGTRVLLVPSIRDANHDFVFPQVMINWIN